MSGPLFGRAYSVVVAPSGDVGGLGAIASTMGFDVSNLRCVFKAKKTLKPEPNTCEVKVYNLAGTSRRVLESASKLVLRLEAGYEKAGTSQIFLGEVRAATSEWVDNGVTCETTVTTGDSEKEMREARLHLSIGPSVPADVALTAIVRALKIGTGNLPAALALLKAKGVALIYGAGSAISGNARRQLTDFCRAAGLEWSIQDGQLQILDLNRPLPSEVLLLSPETGLLGSPTIDFAASSKKKKGGQFVKAKCLIQPGIAPGKIVVIESREVKGGFRIEAVEWSGDTHGEDWFANIVARSY